MQTRDKAGEGRLNSPQAVKPLKDFFFFFNMKDKFQSYFGCFYQEGQVTCHGCNPASRPVTAKAPAQVHNQSTYLLQLSECINRGEGGGWK